jgi:sialic acid synthase SpsE
VSPEEAKSRVFRRSLFVVKDMKVGEVFTEENVRSIRPGDGLHPRYFYEVIGKKASHNIRRGEPLSLEFIDGHGDTGTS